MNEGGGMADQNPVCNIFNDHCVRITQSIGILDTVMSDNKVKDKFNKHNCHPCEKYIKNYTSDKRSFDFTSGNAPVPLVYATVCE